MDFSNDQLKALEILNNGANCFVHGDAGTGKSTVIEHFSFTQAQNGKQIGKCAFTGLATMNLLKRSENETVATINTLFEFKSPFDKKKRKTVSHIANYDVIIIDEISTCTALYFSFVSRYIELANQKRKIEGKKDIQLIVCGDFYQLAPFYDYERWKKTIDGQWEKITDYNMKNAISQIVGQDENGELNLYAFSTKDWQSWNFQYILLTQNHRQEHDLEYKNNLKIMRESSNIPELQSVCNYFNSHCFRKPNKETNVVNLYWKNIDVEAKNDLELEKLPTKRYHFWAFKTGELQNLSADKFKSLPISEHLFLKEGAQVIFTYNDIKNEPRRFANGDLGIIVDCSQESIAVKLLRNNEIIRLFYDQCALTLYKPPKYVKKSDGTVSVVQEKYDGEIYQYPVKLAYALTIYKAQGQTFDNVCVSYSGRSEHILYVALSRARTINNLYLTRPIYPEQITHSKIVEKFYSSLKETK